MPRPRRETKTKMSLPTMQGATPTSVAPAKQSGLFAQNKVVWIACIVIAFLAAGISFSVLSKSTQTVIYYVLAEGVPARTQITADMLLPVVTSAGGQPPTALDISAFDQFAPPLFAQFPMNAQDVVLRSNVGPLTRIDDKLPSGYTVATLQLGAEEAEGGRIRRGDFVDIYAVPVTENTPAELLLHHVLVLDTTVGVSDIAGAVVEGQAVTPLAPGAESSLVRGGIPALYYLAASGPDIRNLATIGGGTAETYMVFSPNPGPTVMIDGQPEPVLGSNCFTDSSVGLENLVPNSRLVNGAVEPAEVEPSEEPKAPADSVDPENWRFADPTLQARLDAFDFCKAELKKVNPAWGQSTVENGFIPPTVIVSAG